MAALARWHDLHEIVRRRIDEFRVVPAYAELEAFSVLTRLPAAQRVRPEDAARALRRLFPGPRLLLPQADADELVEHLAQRGIFGGAVYDALIGLVAAKHQEPLLTADIRAHHVYERLGVEHELLTG